MKPFSKENTLRSLLFLFIGFFLVLVELNINGFDILIDAVGYGLIAYAASLMIEYDSDYRTITHLFIAVLCLDIINSLLFFTLASEGIYMLFSIIILAVSAFAMIKLFTALGAFAKFSLDNSHLTKKADICKTLYLILLVLQILIYVITPLIFIVFILALAYVVYLLLFLYQLRAAALAAEFPASDSPL